MKRTWRDHVADILTTFQEVEDFTCGMEYKHFAADKKTVNAVIRSLEIMGRRPRGYAKMFASDIRMFHGDG